MNRSPPRWSLAAVAVRALLPLAVALAVLLASCGHDRKKAPVFTLSSADVAGGTIAAPQVFDGFGCTGGNVSPQLAWANAPAGTKSFAVTMYDPDAPTGSGFWHWTVFDIPPTATSIPSGAGAASGSPSGGTQGYTDFGLSQYGGPCPPAGDPAHRYVFTVYALKVDTLGLTAGAPGALVSFAANANMLAKASFTASYGRPGTPTAHPIPPTVAGFTLTSAEIPAGGTVPAEQVFDGFGCTGQNVSPSLSWSGAPAGTQGFVLTVYDPDAPTGSGFWHWLVFDIPSTATSIPKGAGTAGASPAGGTQGYTDFGVSGYGGPCPPAGDPAHHYVFTLYAVSAADLATAGGLGTGSTGGLVGFVTRTVAIARAELTATYGR